MFNSWKKGGLLERGNKGRKRVLHTLIILLLYMIVTNIPSGSQATTSKSGGFILLFTMFN